MGVRSCFLISLFAAGMGVRSCFLISLFAVAPFYSLQDNGVPNARQSRLVNGSGADEPPLVSGLVSVPTGLLARDVREWRDCKSLHARDFCEGVFLHMR